MKGGTIRRIANTFKRLLGRPITTHHKDPVLRDQRDRRKKRAHGGNSGRKGDVRKMMQRGHLGPPPCRPGTISYHDKLVRHFGRKEADKYGRIIQARQMDLLPTKEDFANNPPWAFLSTGTG